MTKIPSLDALKKMGSELLDKKHLGGGVVDKIKSGVSSAPKNSDLPLVEVDPRKATLQRLNQLLLELGQDHAVQGHKLKQFRQDLNALTALLSGDKKDAPVADEIGGPEDLE